jgi:hypothetical protein
LGDRYALMKQHGNISVNSFSGDFKTQSPVTTENALAFLLVHFDVHLLANTMQTKVRKDPELRMIRGVPMGKRRLACDVAEIELPRRVKKFVVTCDFGKYNSY